jgi:hypothetical protein
VPSGRFRPVQVILSAVAWLAMWALPAVPAALVDQDLPRGAAWVVGREGEITPEKLERWRRKTPEEKERIRERYRRWESLTPEQRERILERSRRWRELPEDERRYLRERRRIYREARPEEKRVIEEFLRSMRQHPPPRRRQAREFIVGLRGLPEDKREARLLAWPYYHRLDPAERRILRDFLFAEPLPPRPAGSPGRDEAIPPGAPARTPEGRAAPPEWRKGP